MLAASPLRIVMPLIYSMTALAGLAQSISTPQPAQQGSATATTISSTSQVSLQSIIQAQQALNQSLASLLAQGATPAQVMAWHQQNVAAEVSLRQQVLAFAMANRHPLPYTTDVTVPDGASQAEVDFLTTRADLQNRYAQLYNQQLQANAGAPVPINVGAQFATQNAAEVQQLNQQAQVMAAQPLQPLPTPPPLTIPPNVSPQLAAFLTLRDQVTRGRIAVMNQYASATPAVRQAALLEWEQQNAALFQQLRQSVQNLQTAPTN